MTERMITIDTPFEKIVEWDEANYRLSFDTEPDKFKVLNEQEIEKLSSYTKTVYLAMEALYKSAKRVEANPPTPGLKINPRLISPSDKLEVQYPEGFLKKWHPAWLRVDQHRQNVGLGYTLITDEDVSTATPGVGASDRKVVGDSVYQEYELMKIPKETYEERQKAIGERSRHRIQRTEESAKEQMRSAGGVPYEPPEGGADGHNWGPPAPDD